MFSSIESDEEKGEEEKKEEEKNVGSKILVTLDSEGVTRPIYIEKNMKIKDLH